MSDQTFYIGDSLGELGQSEIRSLSGIYTANFRMPVNGTKEVYTKHSNHGAPHNNWNRYRHI